MIRIMQESEDENSEIESSVVVQPLPESFHVVNECICQVCAKKFFFKDWCLHFASFIIKKFRSVYYISSA